MAKFEIQTPGYTYYLETRKIRNQQAWELVQRGVRVANIQEEISGTADRLFKVQFQTGETTTIAGDMNLQKAVRMLVKGHPEKLRGEAIFAQPEAEPQALTESKLPEAGTDGTLSALGESNCPPLTIQFGEVGGIRFDTAREVDKVLRAVRLALLGLGHVEQAEYIRKLYETGMAPIRERNQING
jgi:hypothetical protein